MAEEKEMTSKELQRLLEQDKIKREQTCKSEIEAVLQKHKCQLVALPQISIEGALWIGIAKVQIAILP